MADTHKSCTPTHRAIRQSTHVVIAKGLLLLLSQHVAVCDECWIVFRMMFLTHSLTHFFLLLFPGAAGEKELGNCRWFCKRTGATQMQSAHDAQQQKRNGNETKSVSFFRFRSRSISSSSASSSSCRNYCQLDKTLQTRRQQQSKTTTPSPASSESREKDIGCMLLPSFQCIILTLDDDDDNDTEMVTMDSLQ